MYLYARTCVTACLPAPARPPFQWLKLSPEEVKEQIYKLAKKGLNPSQIGVVLRVSYGVAQVKNVTGNKILRILKSKGTTEKSCVCTYGLLLYLRVAVAVCLAEQPPFAACYIIQ